MSNNKESPRIAVIGPSQSGKTCLAVGLYSTSTRGFSIKIENFVERNYVIELRKKIVGGRWPDPTNKGTVQSLRFDFHKTRRPDVSVEFVDFGGEKLGDDEEWKKFANAHFCNLDGVVLLVNPGADAFQKNDLGLLEDVKTQYNRVLSFLHDPNTKSSDAFVALTVTAADRIRGIHADLRGKDAAFRDCLEEIENTLSSMGFRWRKRPFYISMSGSTGKENKFERHSVPKGWPNTTSRPFLWILDRLGWQSTIRNIMVRCLKLGGITALLSAIAIGAWSYFASEQDHQKVETHFSNGNKACENPGTTPGSLKKAFKDAVKPLNCLQRFNGWFYKDYAIECHQKLEPKVVDILCRWIERECEDLREDPDQRASNSKVAEVDGLFGKLQPKDSKSGKQLRALQKSWEQEKQNLRERYATAQIVNELEKPLVGLIGKHDGDILSLLQGMYTKYSGLGTSGYSSNSIARLNTFANNLDTRTKDEWQWRIGALNASARTNATDDVVSTFLERFEGWNPVTTNGIADKARLKMVVTNSIPKWRDVYEKTAFTTKVENAMKSREMSKLAELHPTRIATNEYLTVKYIIEQWTNHVQGVYEEAYQEYITNFVNAVVERRGCPSLGNIDEEQIKKKAATVGIPFDVTKALDDVRTTVAEKAEEWRSERRNECNNWVNEKVKAERERTGRSSLWNDYETFMRSHRENPFAESIARKAVYAQVEKWFDGDCDFFKMRLVIQPIWEDSMSLPANFAELEAVYRKFSRLCEKVNEDKNPDLTSWAYHFAKYCVEEGKVRGGIFVAFPQTLVIDSIVGDINYYDNKKGKVNYPTNYKRTSFAANVEVIKHETGGTVQECKTTILLPFDKKQKHAKDDSENSCDQSLTYKRFNRDPIRVPIHAFEEVRVIAAVTDYNKVTWAETNTKGPFFVADGSQGLSSLSDIDLSFDKLPRKSGSDHPRFELKIKARIEGASIWGLLAVAKQTAIQEMKKSK